MMDRRLVHRLRSERGTTLIEVIAAAVILVVIAGAVTSLVTGAQRQSGQSRMLAIAGDLAQSELEQLRAKKFSDLVSLDPAPQPVDAGGVKFSVSKSSGWASQGAAGPTDCTSTANAPEALRVSVSVSWESMTRKPVRLDTLVAAPTSEETKGSLVIQVNDRDGTGVPGVTVSVTGPESASLVTQESGCVRFPDLSEGSYTVRLTKSNHVDRLHEPLPTASVSVIGGETASKSFDYDNAGGINAIFLQGTTATAAAVPGAMIKGQDSTLAGTLTAGNTILSEPKPLWPSTAKYEIHADVCTTTDSLPVGNLEVPQGVLNPTPRAELRLPRIRVRATNVPSEFASFLRARVRTACGTVLADVTGAANGGGWLSNPITVPPGKLQSVCAWGTVPGYGSGWVRNTNPGTLDATNPTDLAGTREIVAGDINSVSMSTPVCP